MVTMTTPAPIENDHWRFTVRPELGGALGSGQAKRGDHWVDVLRPTASDADSVQHTSSYPLVPWSNRIRDGKLDWQGGVKQLEINFPDGTAIHGAGWTLPWKVAEQTDTSVTLSLDSREHADANWPWPFTAQLVYSLDGPRFTCKMTLTNAGDEPFPAGLGHHPFFVRGGEHGEPVLQVNVTRGYDLVDCMPTEGAGPMREAADFSKARPVGNTFVDDCYTGRTSRVLSSIDYPGGPTVWIEADDLFSHAVVYIPVDETHFAVEPVTNANDGFALMAKGVEGHGVFVAEPGATVEADFALVLT